MSFKWSRRSNPPGTRTIPTAIALRGCGGCPTIALTQAEIDADYDISYHCLSLDDNLPSHTGTFRNCVMLVLFTFISTVISIWLDCTYCTLLFFAAPANFASTIHTLISR